MPKQASTKQTTASSKSTLTMAITSLLELLWYVVTVPYASARRAFYVMEKRQVLPEIIKKVLEGALQECECDLKQAEAASTASTVVKSVVKIQAWWRDGRETRRRKQAGKILALCGVGSRLAKIFQEASLECNDLDETLQIATKAPVMKEVWESIGAVIQQPVYPCLSKVFLGDDDGIAPLGLLQAAAKAGRGKRAASPDGSTSAGSASECGEDSASEWMTEEAWRPPLGLGPPCRPPPGLELELPDPFEAQCF